MSRINATTACYPGTPWAAACKSIAAGAHEPLWGSLASTHVQLCPQNVGVMDELTVEQCKMELPHTKFRLHASVRLHRGGYHQIVDASTDTDYAHEYIERVAQLSDVMQSNVYTLHAGRRRGAGLCWGELDEMRSRVLRWQDKHKIRIGVEGLYPMHGREAAWLINSWIEYEWLWTSGLFYAVDLSHLNIVAEREQHQFVGLVEALLVNPNCVEVHVSGNEGKKDSHGIITEEPWWMAPFERAIKGGMTAVIFSEANQKKGVVQ